MSDLSEIAADVHATAKASGWWDEDSRPSFAEALALIHSEVSEALEEWRCGLLYSYQGFVESPTAVKIPGIEAPTAEDDSVSRMRPRDFADRLAMAEAGWKPVGIPSEMADIVIRVLDVCEGFGIPLAEALELKAAFNKTRAYRHGGKRL